MRAGSGGGHTSASGPGGRSARTTARTATPGTTFPHDHARSRAYRWNEDGLGGICDDRQALCLGVRVLERADPILKERDLRAHRAARATTARTPRSYWWYLDSTPTHSWMRWRYLYPQRAFPYDELVAENAPARPHDPEFELLDTGVFDDDRYWEITADYAKASPDDLVHPAERRATRDRTRRRCTCCPPCGSATRGRGAAARPARDRWRTATGGSWPSTTSIGRVLLRGDDAARAAVLRERDERRRGSGATDGPAFPKDGIGDHVISGRPR